MIFVTYLIWFLLIQLSVLKSSIEESEEDKVSLNDALLLDNTNLQMSTEKMDIHRQQLEVVTLILLISC